MDGRTDGGVARPALLSGAPPLKHATAFTILTSDHFGPRVVTRAQIFFCAFSTSDGPLAVKKPASPFVPQVAVIIRQHSLPLQGLA